MESKELVEILRHFEKMNADSQQKLAEQIVSLIQHPPKTEEEIALQKKAWADRVELAKQEDLLRARKRKYCGGAADPSTPHRYPDNFMWGMSRGESLIVWGYPQFSSRGPNGEILMSPPTPHGVCKWCHTEFKPGDPDYNEALSWGNVVMAGEYKMNVRTGDAI